MKSKKLKLFDVPICFFGQENYIVKAKNKSEAEKLARARFDNGEDGDLPSGFQKIDFIGEIEEVE